jgi:hypothetical protein
MSRAKRSPPSAKRYMREKISFRRVSDSVTAPSYVVAIYQVTVTVNIISLA